MGAPVGCNENIVEKGLGFILGVAGSASAGAVLGMGYRHFRPYDKGFDSTATAIFGGILYTTDRIIKLVNDKIISLKFTPKMFKEPTRKTQGAGYAVRVGLGISAAYFATQKVAEYLEAPFEFSSEDQLTFGLLGAANLIALAVFANLGKKVEDKRVLEKISAATARGVASAARSAQDFLKPSAASLDKAAKKLEDALFKMRREVDVIEEAIARLERDYDKAEVVTVSKEEGGKEKLSEEEELARAVNQLLRPYTGKTAGKILSTIRHTLKATQRKLATAQDAAHKARAKANDALQKEREAADRKRRPAPQAKGAAGDKADAKKRAEEPRREELEHLQEDFDRKEGAHTKLQKEVNLIDAIIDYKSRPPEGRVSLDKKKEEKFEDYFQKFLELTFVYNDGSGRFQHKDLSEAQQLKGLQIHRKEVEEKRQNAQRERDIARNALEDAQQPQRQ